MKFRVCVLVKCVQVRAHRAGKKDWVLWYDRDAAPQVMETDLRNIDAINVYGTLTCL